MDQSQLISEPQPEAPQLPSMSLGGRLLNVFAAPGEVFQEVKNAKVSMGNWLVPALILIVVSCVASWLVFSQDTIRHQMSEAADRGVQEQIDRGHISEQQAENARAMGEKWADIGSKIGAATTAVAGGFIVPFIWGLFLWLVGVKVFKGNFPYMKAVEVVGLANMINVLDTVFRTLLIVGLGNLYVVVGPVLLVKDFDPQNTMHSLLMIVNIMTFWLLAVRAVGLARLSGASFARAAAWVFGIWASYTGIFVGLGLLLKSLFSRMNG